MGKVRIIQLSDAQRKALEEGYQRGSTHAFRQRCEIILLKSQGRTSEEVGRIVNKHPGYSDMSSKKSKAYKPKLVGEENLFWIKCRMQLK